VYIKFAYYYPFSDVEMQYFTHGLLDCAMDGFRKISVNDFVKLNASTAIKAPRRVYSVHMISAHHICTALYSEHQTKNIQKGKFSNSVSYSSASNNVHCVQKNWTQYIM